MLLLLPSAYLSVLVIAVVSAATTGGGRELLPREQAVAFPVSTTTDHLGALAMAPLHDMPADVQAAPVSVQEAYQFAVANPDVLKELPCYCGCGAMGHTSNYACYVKEAADGEWSYDSHALGCSICVDINQDAMRLLRDGKELKEIRLYVDQTYARYGASNMVP